MPDAPLNLRELRGRRLRIAALTLVGAPLALALLPGYLQAARRGEADRRAPLTMAAVAVSMALMPLWVLLLLRLAGVDAQD